MRGPPPVPLLKFISSRVVCYVSKGGREEDFCAYKSVPYTESGLDWNP